MNKQDREKLGDSGVEIDKKQRPKPGTQSPGPPPPGPPPPPR